MFQPPGPEGVWTRKLKGELVSDDMGLNESWEPSLAHMAIARMQKNGWVKFVATTNVDDLHGKSGLPSDSLAELHGNSFVEECEACLKRYKRSFVTRTATGLFEHRTGRYQSSTEGFDGFCGFAVLLVFSVSYCVHLFDLV